RTSRHCAHLSSHPFSHFFFFFHHTSTTEIYTLSLHDALPISGEGNCTIDALDFPIEAACLESIDGALEHDVGLIGAEPFGLHGLDRKSTRLNSSHVAISYAVFCLKKKKKKQL